MKKTIFKLVSLVCGAAFILGGCTNLDEKVYSSITKDDFFTSESQLVIYSARAYAALQGWGSEQSMWTMNLQLGNEVAVPVNAVGEWKNSRYSELQTHHIPAANKLVRTSWDYCFDGVTACNDVIYEIEHAKQEFVGKDRILAEMKVLRAYFYFLAVDCWGNVPYSIDKTAVGYPEQKDRKFMCDFIEREILDNIDALSKENSPEYYGRITEWVARTILAKLYLNWKVWNGTERWADAETQCKLVMSSGLFSLAKKYKDNFVVANDKSPESVFAIPYSTIYTESDHNAFILFILTLDADLCEAFGIPGAGWDGFVGQPDFVASYDPADTRKADTWLIGQQYKSDGSAIPGYVIDPEMTEGEYTTGRTKYQGARIGKWTFQNDGLIKNDQTSMDNDFILFRYADVVLMYVEALVRQGRVAEAAAVPEFAAIRTRASLPAMTASELTLDNLYLERSHELAAEGWVRQDLIRFGKYNEAWWAKPAGSDYMLLLPIPEERMSVNPNLSQNDGY